MIFSCLINKVKTSFDKNFVYSYGKELDRYITAHNPQNNADVERLMFEYTNKLQRNIK